MLMIFRGAAIAQLLKKVKYMSPGRLAELDRDKQRITKCRQEKNTMLVSLLSDIRHDFDYSAVREVKINSLSRN